MNPHPYAIEQLVQHRQEALLREAAPAHRTVQAPFRARVAAALTALAQRLDPATTATTAPTVTAPAGTR